VAGDFNARAVEWGMPVTNARGRHILEMASRLDLEVANWGSTPTYRRPGFGESIPDLTLVSAELIHLVADWRVMSVYTASDHDFISFRLKETGGHGVRVPETQSAGIWPSWTGESSWTSLIAASRPVH